MKYYLSPWIYNDKRTTIERYIFGIGARYVIYRSSTYSEWWFYSNSQNVFHNDLETAKKEFDRQLKESGHIFLTQEEFDNLELLK